MTKISKYMRHTESSSIFRGNFRVPNVAYLPPCHPTSSSYRGANVRLVMLPYLCQNCIHLQRNVRVLQTKFVERDANSKSVVLEAA